MIKLKGVTKKYTSFSLDNIDLELAGGTIVGLVGRNGSGKTTLLKMICSSISFEQGSITYLGKKICELDAKEKQEISYISLENTVFKTISLKTTVKMCKRIYSSFDEKYFYELIKKFEIDERKRPSTYSTGEYEKLLFAVSLANHPKVLLIDEATAVIDPVSKDLIFKLLKDFVLRLDATVIIATNVVGDLENVCDEIVLLKNGKIIVNDSTDRLLEKYCVIECGKDDVESINEDAIIFRESNEVSERIFGYRKKMNEAFINRPNSLDEIVVYLLKESD